MVNQTPSDHIKAALVNATGLLPRPKKTPGQLLGELFYDVQNGQIYADGKTFVDLVPKKRIKAIQEEYALSKADPRFDLREFIARHFYDVSSSAHKNEVFAIDKKETIDVHISRLWNFLERRHSVDRGSLIALPHRYIVPGGRFNEQFYWDSYFIMLGLAAECEWSRVEGMIKNVAHMIRRYGYVPTANRTYFLSRSQPPFFALMVRLLASHKGKRVLREYAPYLLLEYRFWMRGVRKVKETEHAAYRRVVELEPGLFLNRYYDNSVTPRPESLREDAETAKQASHRQSDKVFLHLRAAAESGWDFSARWLTNQKDLHTIHTADIIPVDLNSLLYILEETIADAHNSLLQPLVVRKFRRLAAERAKAINRYHWSKKQAFYTDYNFHTARKTGFLSLAAVAPLYAGIASPTQAAAVAERLEREFLHQGGLVTSLTDSGQQWDAPNGWAPLQWMAVEGLRRYGFDDLANTIQARWMTTVEMVFTDSHRLVEKYNVGRGDGLGGGGEYALQDGFGWTNGVYAAFKRSFRP